MISIGEVERPVAARSRPHAHGDELPGQEVAAALGRRPTYRDTLFVFREGSIDLRAVGQDGQDPVAGGVVRITARMHLLKNNT